MPTSPILYLAEIQLRTSSYMGANDQVQHTHRLVEGLSEFDAREKICRALEKSDPYGTSVSLDYVELHTVIR